MYNQKEDSSNDKDIFPTDHSHFKGRHSIDDNYKHRMQPIALEETWRMNDWENCLFAFLLVLLAANCQYAWHWFGGHKEENVLQF